MRSSLSTTRPNSVAGGEARRILAWTVAIATLVVALDQLTKWIILASGPAPAESWRVVAFLNIVNVCNPGISFGLFPGHSAIKPWILSGFAVAVVAGLLFWVRNKDGFLPMIATGLVAGGALGNVVDRVRLGCVVDFIDVHAAGWHWPAFNVADSAITLGVAFLIVHGLFFDEQEAK